MVRDGYENMFGTGFNFRKFDGQVLILYGICCARPKFNAVYSSVFCDSCLIFLSSPIFSCLSTKIDPNSHYIIIVSSLKNLEIEAL